MNLLLGDVPMKSADVFNLLAGGTADNPAWSYIVESRLNRSIVAILAGGALAISGLILQVFFRNPLAGPGVLGITSGASLGVAVVVLGGVTMGSLLGNLGIILAGIIGAVAVLFLLLFIARFIRNSVTLLVAGLMFGYFTAALINILFLWANETATRKYVVWGLGSFEGLNQSELLIFTTLIIVLSLLCFMLVKPLNALVAGTDYAASIGINVKSTRLLIILFTGVLAAIVTVYCGPVGFIGIAVPQLVRVLVKSKNHAVILPVVFIAGSLLALGADFIVRMSSNSLPLNTVTAIVGAPIIIWVIVKMNQRNVSF
ncbi:MAG: iron chelate uptake ABC transporter family permease subunit [Crocinitomix sp.]|nr:iron chelate uptake ABC transporter family permease subunit [Crocinitomix sp.]